MSKDNVSRLYSLSVVIFATLIFGAMVWRARFGLDLTDESFYLIWSSNPWIYPVSTSQFGFIYYPLYKLAGESVFVFRCLNLFLTGSLAFVFCRLAFLSRSPGLLSNAQVYGLVSVSMVCAFPFVLTPNYNILSVQAALLIASSICILVTRQGLAAFAGWFLLGFGGWVSFMAKPTSAAILGLMAMSFILVIRRATWKGILTSVLTAGGLLFLTAVVIDGSVALFIARLSGGANLAVVMDPNYSPLKLFRLDDIDFLFRDWVRFALYVAVISSWNIFDALESRTRGMLWPVWFLVLMSLVDFVWGEVRYSIVKGIFLFAVPFAAILVLCWRSLLKRRIGFLTDRDKRETVLLAFLLIAVPYATAFGTNGNYWTQASTAGFFWVVGGVLMLAFDPGASRLSMGPILVAQIIILNLVYDNFKFPYRHSQELSLNNKYVEFGKSGGLWMSRDFANYLDSIRSAAGQAGFAAGMQVLDLTGRSPGVVYALNGVAIGQPWMIGGYSGSEDFVRRSLALVECEEIYGSWLLVEHGGPREISFKVLDTYDLTLDDYENVGQFTSVQSDFSEKYQQNLLKPKRSSYYIEKNCVSTHERKSGK
ncbi:hypothetical protein [Bdellovibrio bacteriovorus]|uniref:Putative membrane protein n=1 Tax=Bdellovibrio bacteriovorus str. Tiberius TaxID=1069642 RepID=K7Z9X6_BDEBC|nr:hypothetical protein [Bdellovibrio bacteriovorus]AFY01379.1 putative membrane protein [Bdellovibrio bacteriovorus str. Tiberius]